MDKKDCEKSEDHYWVDGEKVSGHCRKNPSR